MQRRRGGCALVTMVVLLLLLVAGAFALVRAEAAARDEVERRVATTLAPRIGTTPQVEVGGASALWQLARDDWSSIHVIAPDAVIPVQGRSVPASIDATAADVTGLTRGRTVTVGRVDGSGRLDWKQLSTLADVQLGPAPDGKVLATREVEIPLAGRTVPVRVTAAPSLQDGHTVRLTREKVSVEGIDLPSELVDRLVPEVLGEVALPELPELRYTGLASTDEGLALTAEGSGISVEQP